MIIKIGTILLQLGIGVGRSSGLGENIFSYSCASFNRVIQLRYVAEVCKVAQYVK